MDALLLELEKVSKNPPPPENNNGHYGPGENGRPLPDKMGSFVQPGEEHLTTNIFVGNLAPVSTEEELTEAFRQFGKVWCLSRTLCLPVFL